MHTQTRKTTVTFTHSFQLDGFEMELPAGMYDVESKNEFLNGMFLPDCLRPSVLIHLHATPGSTGHAQTMSVPRATFEAALLRDRSPATMTSPEIGLEEMLRDPGVQQLMRSDGVSDSYVRDLISHLLKRTPFHAKPNQ